MAVKPIPDGYSSVTPYLIVSGASKALDYYKKAFGANELMRFEGPGGTIMHAEMQIGNARVMLADESRATQAREYLFELGPDAVPGIHEALKVAVESRHRADLVQAIGYLGGSNDVTALQAMLQDRDQRIQRAAQEAVTRLKRVN